VRQFLLTFLPALLLALGPAAPAGATEVLADDLSDSYVISGAIILNGTFTEAQTASSCGNCQWRVIRVCTAGGVEDRSACLGTACVASEDVAEVWRADAPSPPPVGDPLWTYRGTMCLTEPPVAATVVTAGVHDLALRSVPPILLASQPTVSTLTGLPTYFRSGQPAQFQAAPATVAGTLVTLRAQPVWTWDFGQGATLTTSDPGGPYPSGRVRHTYPRRGIFRVRVTCSWHATYSTRGLTDIPVDGVITQSAWIDLRVHEARRYLTNKGA
jgi:hypothetical protein